MSENKHNGDPPKEPISYKHMCLPEMRILLSLTGLPFHYYVHLDCQQAFTLLKTLHAAELGELPRTPVT